MKPQALIIIADNTVFISLPWRVTF